MEMPITQSLRDVKVQCFNKVYWFPNLNLCSFFLSLSLFFLLRVFDLGSMVSSIEDNLNSPGEGGTP